MPTVDSHVHVAPNWYEPVESLLYHLDATHIDRALLVQQQGQHDNRYLLDCVARYPDRLDAVVLVDAAQPDAVATLTRWQQAGAKGVRLRAHDRSPGDDPYAIWRHAGALGLPVSVAGSAAAFADPAFAALLDAIPATVVILEHLGSVNVPDGEGPPFAVRRSIFALARHHNVSIKFHGLGEICPKVEPFPQPFPFDRAYTALLDLAYAAFGPARLLWGSDWPPVSGREGYANAYHWPRAHFQHLPAAELDLLFGDNAQRLYDKLR